MKNGLNYQAWQWSYQKFPKEAPIEEKIKFFIQAGILAANIHNTQPWKFEIEKNVLYIYPDKKYQLQEADPQANNLFISLGCCATNIECAAAYHNYKSAIKLLNHQKNISIQITFSFVQSKNNEMKELAKLSTFIAKRFSNKYQYLNKPINPSILDKISAIRQEESKTLISNDPPIIRATAKYQERAIKNLVKKKKFAKELSTWLRLNNTKSYDGMPGFVVGLNPIQAQIGKFFLNKIPQAMYLLAKKDKSLIERSPAIGLITTSKNDLYSYFIVGKMYEKIVLTSFSQGIFCTPMHSIIEDKEGFTQLKKVFNLNTTKPAFFFRLGYSNIKPYHTPRKDIKKVLLNMNTENVLAKTIPTKIDIKSIKIDNYDINYAVTGEGKPVVLIHGGNIGWGQWYPNITAIAGKFKVYAIDLPGGGRSTKIDYANLDMEKDLVETVNKFIKELKLIKPHIIGSSISGWIALKLALKNKNIGKIVAIDSIGFSNYTRPQDKIIRIYPIAKFLTNTILKAKRTNKNIEMFIRSVFYNSKLSLKKEFIEYFYETMSQSHNLLFISKLTSKIKETFLADELSKIKNEILIIWGKNDMIMPLKKSEQNFKKIPKAQVVVIENAGHFPSLEQSLQFNKEVLRFLKN